MQIRSSGSGCGGGLLLYFIVLGIATFLALWGYRADIAPVFWLMLLVFFLGGLVVAYLTH
jgi:hypothetical protein